MEFSEEICVDFPEGLKSLDKPLVEVSAKIAVCLDCGLAQFSIPEAELDTLAKGPAA